MAKKSKASKVLGAIVAVALIGRASVYGYKLYKDYIDSYNELSYIILKINIVE